LPDPRASLPQWELALAITEEMTELESGGSIGAILRNGDGGTRVTMKASRRRVDGVTILDLSGRIILGGGSDVLRDQIRDLLDKNEKKILLNLGDITYIDSSGIGELVSAFTTVRSQGGELKLLNLPKKVHDLLQITKFFTIFDIKDVKDDEASAVKAFTK
jgi:anti-sigma B factor antagonist